MNRETLLDFFDDRIRSSSDFLVYDNGYRTYRHTYAEIREAATRLARRLTEAGLAPDQKVVIWGENRPEWVVALWGCLLSQTVVVPVDYRASSDLLGRVVEIVDARVILVGDEVKRPPVGDGVQVWSLNEVLLQIPSGRPGIEQAVPSPAPVLPIGARGSSGDLAEIIFTSGATADPKGVQLTHRNILANIVPVEREILRYRKYARPFSPLRFLNLLPLSHMFGQAMATFIPPMLSGVTVFMRGYNPADIVQQIRSRRISVLVCVPKMLEVLRDHLTRVAPEVLETPSTKEHVARRWWRYRRVHRMFGMKFWAFVVGAAPLDPDLEAFWTRLGFLVVQGYGLTETAPIVTLNHPFRARRGSVGTPIGGVEVKIAPDGEILVRGDNVTSGYYNAPDDTTAAFRDGWFHTGDIGAIDDSGRLAVRGRKKEMIVTPEGLNVFPEDVERVLLGIDGVKDAAVVGAVSNGQERVHAILVLTGGTESADVLREVNSRLEDHQRIRGCSVWPDETLPRTDGTQKLKRRELQRWLEQGAASAATHPARDAGVIGIVQGFVADRKIDEKTTLEELGLSSIERIELMMALEREFDRSVDEHAFAAATTIADLESLVDASVPAVPAPGADLSRGVPSRGPRLSGRDDFPRWNRRPAAKLLRRVGLAVLILPLTRVFAWISVDGLDRLAKIPDPVVYAANHQSHMDAPVILAAMPSIRRNRVAIAAAKEFFAAHFHPDGHTTRKRVATTVLYYLSSLVFNVFPLPQRESGARDAIRYVGDMLGEGTSVLIFPEGRRTETGAIDSFQPGIGMIASRLRVPIVPVRIEGVDRILHQKWRMARPGRAKVSFGEPLWLEGDDYKALALKVEKSVKYL